MDCQIDYLEDTVLKFISYVFDSCDVGNCAKYWSLWDIDGIRIYDSNAWLQHERE